MSAAVTWSSSASHVASVSASGLVSAVTNGTATITAQSGAASATVSVTVQQVAAAVVVSTSSATLSAIGDTVRLSAAVKDAGGADFPGAPVTWSSSDPGVATVSGTGLVTAVADGTTTLTATSGAATGTASVKVERAAITVTVTPGALAMVFPGETVRLAATATDSGGNDVDVSTLEWASTDIQVVSVSATGVAVAVGDGAATITATTGGAVGSVPVTVSSQATGHAANKTRIPMGGNSWVIDGDGGESVGTTGVIGWTAIGSTVRTYVRVNQAGTFMVSLTLDAPSQEADLQVSIGDTKRLLVVGGGAAREYFAGPFTIAEAGYVSVDVTGLSRLGADFGEPSAIHVSGTAVTEDMNFVKNDDDNMFFFGRRGPSTHLLWSEPPATNVAWMYSELTVPAGQDVMGSYFMANGFTNGYFGMQVNGPDRRQFLFSIWSPFETDDPSSIPEDQRVKPLRQGDGVVIAEFGAEGSGGQSRLEFDWKAGSTYGFLTRFQPNGNGTTDYTAWVHFPETQEWKLIASFRRPQTEAYASGLYSFLENFLPEQGNVTRSAFYENQWVADESGNWLEIRDLSFSVDNTGGQGFRKDFTGGVSGGRAFLKIAGFFDDYGVPGTVFTRAPSSGPPVIDSTKLP
jgi:uncharacterized protein YjdB